MKTINIGNGTAVHADCLELMATMSHNSVDLTVTSPPYDDLRSYGKTGYFDWRAVCRELFRVTKPGGTVVWIVNDQKKNFGYSMTSFEQALFMVKECGFLMNDPMIWEKPTFTNVMASRSQYAPVYEFMFVFTKGPGKTFNPIMDRPNINGGKVIKVTGNRTRGGKIRPKKKDSVTIAMMGQRFNVWKMATASHKESGLHPARMPLQLAVDHIVSWSNPGDVVFDPMGGSFTTALAAQQTGRQWISCEIHQEYFDNGVGRINEYLTKPTKKPRTKAAA